jgi:hypothetical protein
MTMAANVQIPMLANKVSLEHPVSSFTLRSSGSDDEAVGRSDHPSSGALSQSFAEGSEAETPPSIYAEIEAEPPIEAFHKDCLYRHDPSATKVNLTIGAYRTDEGRPWVLPVVAKALKHEDMTDFEYLNVLGHKSFSRAATELLLGEKSSAIAEGRTIGVQCLSGTGSLHIGAYVLRSVLGYNTGISGIS